MIPITVPFFGPEEAAAAARVVESGWVAQGPKVAEFEKLVAEYCGVAEAVAVSSGTDALHLALLALGIGPGDEVVCPSLSFIATANSIRFTGATPVFADVDPRTFNVGAETIEPVITDRTKAIMVVHQIGLPADLDAIQELGRSRNLLVLEDAACAFGSRYKGTPIGGHSELACFSLHPRKVITTGEGGLVTTNNKEHARKVRLTRQHGMGVPVAGQESSRPATPTFECLGYNSRMTDIQAAIGIEQMKKLDQILTRRNELASRYTAAFTGHPWLDPPLVPDYAYASFQSYAVTLREGAPISRDQLVNSLVDAGIGAQVGIALIHEQPPYAGKKDLILNGSLNANRQSLLLPLYPTLTDSDHSRILDGILGLLP